MHMPMMDANNSSDNALAGSHSSLSGQSRASHSFSDRDGRDSRASSVTQYDIPSENEQPNTSPPKNIDEVVSSVVADGVTLQQLAIPPELLVQITREITPQITANVLQHFRANSVSAPAVQPLDIPANPHDSNSSFGTSPTVDRTSMYTPPSPMPAQVSPKLTSPTFAAFPQATESSTGTSTGNRRRQTSPGDMRRAISPRGHTSQTSDSDSRDEKTRRPKLIPRISTNGDATTLEKCWGNLFSDGQCTERLGQFLRGIAMHINEDYGPKNTLVITPEKMLRYYEETKLPTEFYPWSEIFDDKTSCISRMFRELEVEHHLVQENLSERPDVPALTPRGFERWMTLILKAQPDLEYDRLALTALHMPINNPDDASERFPKQLSPRLFHKQGDRRIALQLAKSMSRHCNVKLPVRQSSESDTDSKVSPTSAMPNSATQTSNNYRPPCVEPEVSQSPPTVRSSANMDRPNLPTIDSGSVAAEQPALSKPIERERKPYVAQPGGGKSHDDLDTAASPLQKTTSLQSPSQTQSPYMPQPPTVQPHSHSHSHSVPPPEHKLTRSMSVASNGRGNEPTHRSAPVAIHQQPPTGPSDSRASDSLQRRNYSNSSARVEPRSSRNRSPSEPRRHERPRRADTDVRSNRYYVGDSNGGGGYSAYPRRGDGRYDKSRQERGSFSAEGRDSQQLPPPPPQQQYRPRIQSMSSADGHRQYPTDKDYYRDANPVYPPPPPSDGYGSYPPNSYRK